MNTTIICVFHDVSWWYIYGRCLRRCSRVSVAGTVKIWTLNLLARSQSLYPQGYAHLNDLGVEETACGCLNVLGTLLVITRICSLAKILTSTIQTDEIDAISFWKSNQFVRQQVIYFFKRNINYKTFNGGKEYTQFLCSAQPLDTISSESFIVHRYVSSSV